MQNILLIIFLIVTLVMIVTVLLQKSEGGALGMGGGGGGRLMSGRSAKNAISKFTWWLGAAFMGMSLLMTILAAQQSGNDFIVLPDGGAPAQTDTTQSDTPSDFVRGLTPPPLTPPSPSEPRTPERSLPISPLPSLVE